MSNRKYDHLKIIVCALAAVLMLQPALSGSPQDAVKQTKILTVGEGGDYPTIRQAVHAARAGDTVLVAEGTYRESVRITKPLRLTGMNTDTIKTILSGKNGDAVLTILAPGVIVENLKISPEGGSVPAGAHVRAGGAILRNVLIEGFSGEGVVLDGVSDTIVRNCYFVRNRLGLALRGSERNTLYHNFFFDNELAADAYLSAGNTWRDDQARGNFWSGYTGRDNGSRARVAGDGIGDTDLPYLGLDGNPLVFPAGMKLIPGCDDCESQDRISDRIVRNQAATDENTTDNGDGTFTFTQQVDENSSPPHYTNNGAFGMSHCSGTYGWQHTFPDYAALNLQIQSVTLSIRAWDVDAEPWRGYEGEYDGVTGDGSWLNPQYLQGVGSTWSVTDFDVDPSALMDGQLNVEVDIDMHDAGWCTTLDYSQLRITYTFIDNDPPYTPTLAVTPTGMTTTNDDLIVTVTGPDPADPNGDSVTYLYRWLVDPGTGNFIDDEFAGRGDNTGATVPSSATQDGDKWMVEVTPIDEHGARGTKNSVQFAQIGGSNTPPVADAGGDQTVDVGATCTLDGSGSYDADGAISTYLWELYSGGTWNTIGGTETISHTFSAIGNYTVRLTVTDDGGAGDDSLAYITVEQAVVNQAPVVSGIPDQTIDEGQSFVTVSLDDYVSDPDNDDDQMSWGYAGNSQLTVDITGRVATITIPSADWNGAETITFTATDPGGESGGDAAVFTVNPVNDPPVVSGIPDQTIDEGQTFATVNLDDYVTDSDNTDAQMNWAHAGNSQLTVAIVNRMATITIPSADWNGAETITFTATDPGGESGGDAAVFTVSPVNDPPAVSGIPDQTIDEGQSFATVNLDDYVSDPDNTDAQMNWGYAGNTQLTVAIVNRVATITIPSADWNGAETITFTATDPGGESGGDAAVFTVSPINDPPVVSGIPDQTIDEGQSFSTVNLDDYVTDPDNTDAQMNWSYSGNTQLTVSIAGRVATIAAPSADWNGAETITFTAADPDGQSSGDAADFTVNPINDPPTVNNPIPDQTATEDEAFTFTFAIETFTDPDAGDSLSYEAAQSEGSVLPQWLSFDPASRTFSGTPRNDDTGELQLRVTAQDGSGGSGDDTFILMVQAVNDAPVLTVPPGKSTDEETELSITGVSLSDMDAGDKPLQVSLSVTSGMMTLAGTTGLTFHSGDGISDAAMEFEGRLPDLNSALGSLIYLGNEHFTGDDTLSIRIDDLGHAGSGGPRTDAGSVAIEVGPVNDAPIVTAPFAVACLEDEEKLIAGVSVDDVDAGEGKLDMVLEVQEGLIFLNEAAGLALDGMTVGDKQLTLSGDLSQLNQALAMLTYRGENDFSGADELSISINDNGNTGSGGWKADEARVRLQIDSVNDAPVAVAGDVQHVVAGANVTLDGTESFDPEGGDLTYHWEQTGGPSVDLSDPDAAKPQFTAPGVDSVEEIMSFMLTVEDSAGLTSSDTVAVTVRTGIQRLYFLRIICGAEKETRITLINSDPDEAASGGLTPYAEDGRRLFGTLPIELLPSGKEEMLLGDLFSPTGKISYLVFETEDPGITGRLEYIGGSDDGMGFEAVQATSREQAHITRIASNDDWETEFAFLNTTPLTMEPCLEFDNGTLRLLTIAPHEQIRFSLRELFDDIPQPDIGSARLIEARGVLGVQILDRDSRKRPVMVDDEPRALLHFPFLPDSDLWWSRFDFVNGADTREKIKLTFYDAEGRVMGREKLTIRAGNRLRVDFDEIAFPVGTAWMTAEAPRGITGEIIFGSRDDAQLGGYSAVDLAHRETILPVEGLAEGCLLTLINSENEAAVLTIEAWDIAGNPLASRRLDLPARGLVEDIPAELFLGAPVETCSHITIRSDHRVLGYTTWTSLEDGRLSFILVMPIDRD